MLGLSSISSRIAEIEQLVQRSSAAGKGQPLAIHSIPALPDAATIAGTNTSTAAAASPSPAATHASVLSKLAELSTAFQHIASQDPTVQLYLSRAPAIESLVENHSSASAGLMLGLPSSTLLRQEEGVVLSAGDSLASTAQMLEQLQSLLPILDQKWPLDHLEELEARVQRVQDALPRQAFLAAQQSLAFERFLQAYHALMDFLSRQFLLWNQKLEEMERMVDEKIAQKQQQLR